MKVSYDTDAGASYIKLSANKIVRTIEVEHDVMVDIDAQGDVVGVEFLMHLREVDDELIGQLEHLFPSLAILAKDPGQWRLSPA